MRWSKYDKYRAEQEASVSDDPMTTDNHGYPSEDSSDGDT
jgi:hypothetical protein